MEDTEFDLQEHYSERINFNMKLLLYYLNEQTE